MESKFSERAVGFIGTAGIPNRYGGFESFLENCAQQFPKNGIRTIVTCYSALYSDRSRHFGLVERRFIPVSANGLFSVAHDLLAFLVVFPNVKNIVMLGTSGALWLPILRPFSDLFGKRIAVNVDGIEWRRGKYGFGSRLLLRCLDYLAQRFAHCVIIDNAGLESFVFDFAREKTRLISYSGDHVRRRVKRAGASPYALTIARIEPENNIELLIEGFLASSGSSYAIIGNWNSSEYSSALRAKYCSIERLSLIDPVYDPELIAEWRENCAVYIHGHSVGGSNPSLIEMLFYDRAILAFDCIFNRETAKLRAHYFQDSGQLTALLNRALTCELSWDNVDLCAYTAEAISAKYMAVFDESST